MEAETRKTISQILTGLFYFFNTYIVLILFFGIWSFRFFTSGWKFFSIYFVATYSVLSFLFYWNKIKFDWRWELSSWIGVFCSLSSAFICDNFLSQNFGIESYLIVNFPGLFYLKVKTPYVYFPYLLFLATYISKSCFIYFSRGFNGKETQIQDSRSKRLYRYLHDLLLNFSAVFAINFSIPLVLHFAPSLRQLLNINSIDYVLLYFETLSISLWILPVYALIFSKFRNRMSSIVVFIIDAFAFTEFLSFLYIFASNYQLGMPVFFASMLSLLGVAIGFTSSE